MSDRLTLAVENGFLLPPTGEVLVFGPAAGTDLTMLPHAQVRIVQPFCPDHDHFQTAGYECAPVPSGRYGAAVICTPRAKALARAMIHAACCVTDGPVLVDGAKTNGIDSLLKDIRKRVAISPPLAKAHGKVFWFQADSAAFADWAATPMQVADRFDTAPGVFSADGIDPASAMLAGALPAHLGRRVGDLGAGWGFLADRLLQNPKLEQLDLVEADHAALDCARRNITDPRAQFHWVDACTWGQPATLDAIVMNPPFHVGRTADPALGRAFIQSAARLLTPGGTLWMVANRHLGYETELAAKFAKSGEVTGDARFKVLRAERPSRVRR